MVFLKESFIKKLLVTTVKVGILVGIVRSSIIPINFKRNLCKDNLGINIPQNRTVTHHQDIYH